MSWGERSEARLLYLCMSKVGKEIRSMTEEHWLRDEMPIQNAPVNVLKNIISINANIY